MPKHYRALIAEAERGGPTGPDGVDRDPRCWYCAAVIARGGLRRPYTLACPKCDAVTVAPQVKDFEHA